MTATAVSTGHQSPWRDELRATLSLAWPLILTNLSMSLIGATDVVMVGWLAWDVGVRSVREVDPHYQPLLAEELQESKDSCTSDPHPPPTGILQEVRSGEVPLAALNERGELPAGAGQAHPCTIQCVEHLFCHGPSLTHMIPSINRPLQSL
jgi:hypothetical protein